MNAPMRGATATARCSSAVAAATSPTTGPSRQVTAQNASSAWSSRPSPSRPTNASANPSSVDASPWSAASRASASSGQAGRPRYSSWRTPASKRVWFRRRPSGSFAASGAWAARARSASYAVGGLTVVVERASRVARAVGEEVVDRALEATRLAERDLGGAEGRVDRAVEHEGAHVLGVRVGVAGAEERAVGVPDERQPILAQRDAEPFEVLHRVGGRHVREQVAAPRRARLRQRGHPVDQSGARRAGRRAGTTGRRARRASPRTGSGCCGRRRAGRSRRDRTGRAARPACVDAIPVRKDTPGAPGPPGLNTSEPMRWRGSRARFRITARSMVGPAGAAGSSGTVSVPHWNPPSQACQAMAFAGGSAALADAAPGRPRVRQVTRSSAHAARSGRVASRQDASRGRQN